MTSGRIAAFLLACALAVTAGADTGWRVPKSVQLKVHEQGAFISAKDYTVYRQGSNLRIEGTYPVYGGLARMPHVEIHTDAGSFLHVPGLKAAHHLVLPLGIDRAAITNTSKISKRLFSVPKSLLEKELKKPARFEGEERIAGRSCYLLTTADPRSSIHQEKQWIDTTYGFVLKYQRIEAGKVTYEREVTEAKFNEELDPALFAVPEGARVVTGLISTLAFERLNSLGGETEFKSDLLSLADANQEGRKLDWMCTFTPPEGMKHALTAYKPPVMARRPGVGGGQSGTGVVPPPGGSGRRGDPNRAVWVAQDEDGNRRVQVVAIGDEGEVSAQPTVVLIRSGDANAEGEMTLQIDGDNVQRIELSGEDIIRMGEMRPGDPNWMNRVREMMRQRQGSPTGSTEGMFVSEFIDPASGKSLVFYQAEGADPTSAIGSRSLLGEPELVKEADLTGTYFHATTPYDRSVLVWQKNKTWFALSAAGLSREELLAAARTLKRLR